MFWLRYLGSKNKIAKEIIPIIQGYITDETTSFIDCFCGGANIIDKISCKNKIGYDIHPQLIALLNFAKEHPDDLPERISEVEYNMVKENQEDYDDWYVGLVGFCASFGAKYFGGYARNYKGDNSGDWSASAIKALKQQSQNFENIEFIQMDFRDINKDNIKNSVIYCDIPYRNATKYKTPSFPYEEFYDFVRELSENNVVIVSEYDMPEDFEIIWEKEVKTNLDNNISKSSDDRVRTERLFIYKKRKD